VRVVWRNAFQFFVGKRPTRAQRLFRLLRRLWMSKKLKRIFHLVLYPNGVSCMFRYLTNLRDQLWLYHSAYDMRYV